MRIAVIGAGAAGCFCAVETGRRLPEAEICVYEAGARPLAKLAVTGGGRCNITNTFEGISRPGEAYPRGEQLMRRALGRFGWRDTLEWFGAEGIRFTIQEDGCVFPASQDAMQIVRTLLRLMDSGGIRLRCGKRLQRLEDRGDGGFSLHFSDGSSEDADKVVFTPGGCSRPALESMLPADISITDTVPSLFTFTVPDEGLRSLMGTVAENVTLGLAGTKFRASGALLLTDWGMSGPATLRLSSYAARELAARDYRATVIVNWTGMKDTEAREMLESMHDGCGGKLVSSIHPEGITGRLWRHLLQRSGTRDGIRWGELGAKGMNRIAGTLAADSYEVTGKAKFKEEFVTCGGVALSGIDTGTLESRTHPGLFFAGEVLDVDAVTGGFNLQAAWSTARTVSEFLSIL